MMHRAWSSIVEVPYSFSRSYVKFQGHTALKIVEFGPNWAFPDSNSSLNSPMAMKCSTKLETAKERCPIVFQGHPSNFKVTRAKTSPILTQIGRFRTIGRSQLSNPSDLHCYFIDPQNYLNIMRNCPYHIKNETLDEIKTSLENLCQRMIQLFEFFQYSFVFILKRKCLVGASRVRCGESGTPSIIIYTRWSNQRYELGCDVTMD